MPNIRPNPTVSNIGGLQSALYQQNPYGIPVASRNTVANSATPFFVVTGSQLQGLFRQTFFICTPCNQLRICLTNWGVDPTNGDLANTNAITHEVSLEPSPATNPTTTATNAAPFLFGGQRTVTIYPGGTVWSDPIPYDFAAGTRVAIRDLYTVAASGNKVPQGGLGQVAASPYYEGYIVGATITDQTGDYNTQAAALTFNGTNSSHNTVGLWGVPNGFNAKAVAIVGDSIDQGVGDNKQPNCGWADRALNGVLPYLMICRATETAQTFSGNGTSVLGSNLRRPLVRGCQVALYGYGTNDDFAGTSLANLQSYTQTNWANLRKEGVQRIYARTLVPRTNSTDSWATTTNQTPMTGNTVRVGYNNWIRNNWQSLGLSGYFETADACESSRDSGFWAVNGTANYATVDGVHPTPTFHAAMAALVTPANL